MAGENDGGDKPRMFTEGEAYALVADAVERETASANAEVETLKADNAKLLSERDAAEVRATAAETAKAEADQALVDYKAEIATQKAAEVRRVERLAEVAKVAPQLKLEGERADRIVAMEDAHFEEYLTGLREVAGTPGESKPKEGLPRESAAFGGGKGAVPGSKPAASVKGLFSARSALSQPKSA